MTDLLETALETARLAADAAAAVHRAHGTSVSVGDATQKGRADYVSATDLEAQEACVAVIRERHPEHAILAEEDTGESLEVALPDGLVWVVDPLDGTANFLHDHPMHAASVALAIDGDSRRWSGIVRAHRRALVGRPWVRGLEEWRIHSGIVHRRARPCSHRNRLPLQERAPAPRVRGPARPGAGSHRRRAPGWLRRTGPLLSG